MTTMFEPIMLPDVVWRTDSALEALRARDAAGLLRLAHRHGASQHRIANAVGILQGRVSEILRGQRQVEAFEVFERIADGLAMPDHARHVLGLAARKDRSEGQSAELFGEIVRVFVNQAAAASDIQTTAKTAAHVDVLAVRALGIIGMKDSLLRSAFSDMSRPVTVRVLLLDPDSQAAAGIASRVRHRRATGDPRHDATRRATEASQPTVVIGQSVSINSHTCARLTATLTATGANNHDPQRTTEWYQYSR